MSVKSSSPTRYSPSTPLVDKSANSLSAWFLSSRKDFQHALQVVQREPAFFTTSFLCEKIKPASCGYFVGPKPALTQDTLQKGIGQPKGNDDFFCKLTLVNVRTGLNHFKEIERSLFFKLSSMTTLTGL